MRLRGRLKLNNGSRWHLFAGLIAPCRGLFRVRLTRVRADYRHSDEIAGDASAAELRRYDRPLTIAFAIAASLLIAAIVTVALEPGSDLQVAGAGPHAPALADPCDNQTWPHLTAACIASKSARRH